MGLRGKNTKSIKVKDVQSSRRIVSGIKSVKFYHQATEGQTIIDITNLTTPSGVSNPLPSTLSQMKMKSFSENLILTSSSKKKLMEGSTLAYTVLSETSIKLNFEAEQGEIFEGSFFNHQINGTVIADVRTPGDTGDLLEDQRDFNLGEAIPIGDDLNNQWPIQVFRNDKPMYRNDGNAEFIGDDSIGNYQMVDSGDGNTQIIRFNIPGDVDNEPIAWASQGALGERPNLSVLQQVDALNGILEKIADDVLEEFGYDITEPNRYAGVPTNIDLKTFGDRVLQAEKDISTLKSRVWNQADFYEEFVANGVSIYGGTQDYKLARVGSTVTLTAKNASTASSNSGISGVFIPVSMRPTTAVDAYFADGTRIRNFWIRATTTGAVSVVTDDNAQAGPVGFIPPFTMSWVI